MTDAHETARERYCDNFVGGHEEWPAVWAMAEKSLDAVACIELVVAMSEVSEEWSCATWHSGIELILARAAEGIRLVEERHGFCEVERREMENLLALSAKCGGWWEWSEERWHPAFVPGWIPPGARS